MYSVQVIIKLFDFIINNKISTASPMTHAQHAQSSILTKLLSVYLCYVSC